MDTCAIETFLKELGGFERELLKDAIIEGIIQFNRDEKICLREIYEKMAEKRGVNPKVVERKIRIALEMTALRGNRAKMLETFGERMGRCYVTPTIFVNILARKFS